MDLTFRNVNDAFRSLVWAFHNGETEAGDRLPLVRRPSRYGDTITLEEPALITYVHPRERVLFNAARDCNPFALLYEALWMLAGRNDVAPLAYYTKRFAEFSDDGKTLNDAYGYRWRHAAQQHCVHCDQSVDQLDLLVAHLKANPNSRRAVLQMWNVEDDLLKIGGFGNRIRCDRCHGTGFIHEQLDPLEEEGPEGGYSARSCPKCGGTTWVDEPASKAVCCNTEVMFSLREVPEHPGSAERQGNLGPDQPRALDMTVINRSNDMIWGVLGANFVTFSILQEYLAARLGVEVGRYTQFTNNLHVYTNNWKPEEWLDDEQDTVNATGLTYGDVRLKSLPLVQDPAAFEEQLPPLVDYFDGSGKDGEINARTITEPFLWDVARPMFSAFARHKRGHREYAAQIIQEVRADDWRLAGQKWLERRAAKAATRSDPK